MSNYRYEGYGVIRDLKNDIPYHTDDIVDLLEEKDIHIAELQKQLEEKEKDIKWLTENYNKERHRANEIADTAMKHNYDMAIQQLQKVKEELNNSAREYVVRLTDGIPVYSSYVTLTQLNETIEETINELKEMK